MRTIPLLVPDELANLVRSIAQQDAGELEQDDFNHGHGVCEWVTASMRICSKAWTMASAPFFVHNDGEQFPIVMENRPVARALVFDDVVHGSGIWMDVSSTKVEPQKQPCHYQAEGQHDSPFEECEQPREQEPACHSHEKKGQHTDVE